MSSTYDESYEVITTPCGGMIAEFTMIWNGKSFKHTLGITDVEDFEDRKEFRLKWAREECIKQLLKFKGCEQINTDEIYG